MIKRCNMLMQVVLFIVTLGIYSLYWFYVTSKEMVQYKSLNGSPILWTVMLFVPFGSLYSYWKHSKAVSAVADDKYPFFLIFILWLFFSPALWAITQIELNRLATQ
jgi:hypothetical protein